MKQLNKCWIVTMLFFLCISQAKADEGMWIMKELNAQNIARMKELGFELPIEQLYNDSTPSIANAVVIFGGGCTGITVSQQGLVFTNHHCGFGAIQQLSSVEHDYLKNGFVSQSLTEELPVPGLTVKYIKETVDVSEQILSQVNDITDEYERVRKIDEISHSICDSLENNFTQADVVPFYSRNKYYLVVYNVYRDVRLVFAPPSSVGKFGGDTDNWMWPRHTGDFSVFRVYANTNNQPAEYSTTNKPYDPKYVAEVSIQGYQDKDYAMIMGFPGSTNRYLSSWGVKQRIEDSNKPRIEVREVKQDIWKKAMAESDAVRIKYASKYAGSSNYWKNSIGMNRGLANLNVIARKQAEEAAFNNWVNQTPERKEKYGNVLNLLDKGYTSTNDLKKYNTYLQEAFPGGTEIIRLARTVGSVDTKNSTPEDLEFILNENIRPFFKNYECELDQQVLLSMLKIIKERVPAQYLTDIYPNIDKKYKGNYAKYVTDIFKKSKLTTLENVEAIVASPKLQEEMLKKDPIYDLALATQLASYSLVDDMTASMAMIEQGERLYFAALKEMYPDSALYSDANFTMRLTYGSIGGYKPYDAAWYDYFSTQQGILEKEDDNSSEFWVQPEILSMIKQRNFGEYANKNGDLQLCFLSNNDITGGNSGSPVFDSKGRVIGLAFDGNWEAMSGDIAFEPDLQRCINVDIRYVLYLIDKWGKCPRLLNELKLAK